MLRNIKEALHLYWRLIKTNFQIIKGTFKVMKLPQPRVTVFGGHLLPSSSGWSSQAHALTQYLMNKKISVITGGGPGIMQAADCGTTHHSARKKASTLAITVEGIEEHAAFSYCAQQRISVNYFYARKWLMMNYSMAFVIFPGGFGTLDELCEALMLMQTKLLKSHKVVLIGVEYWQAFMEWMNRALQEGLIEKEDIQRLTITDDINYAADLIYNHCYEELTRKK